MDLWGQFENQACMPHSRSEQPRRTLSHCMRLFPQEVHCCCHLWLSTHETTAWRAEALLWLLHMNSTPSLPCLLEEACGLIEFALLLQVSHSEAARLKLVTGKRWLKWKFGEMHNPHSRKLPKVGDGLTKSLPAANDRGLLRHPSDFFP